MHDGLYRPARTAARHLRGDDAPVCPYGRDCKGHRRPRRALLHRPTYLVVARPRRADRRLPAPSPLCPRVLHHVLPVGRPGHGQRRTLTRRARHRETRSCAAKRPPIAPRQARQTRRRGLPARQVASLLSRRCGVGREGAGDGLHRPGRRHHTGRHVRRTHGLQHQAVVREEDLPSARTRLQRRLARHRHPPHVHSHRPLHPRADCLRYRRVGRPRRIAQRVVCAIHLCLPLAARQLDPHRTPDQNTGADDQQGYRRTTESGLRP